MEAIQIVKYGTAGHYVKHYDWSKSNPRRTTFFVYLYANVTGGGTHFPLLKKPVEKNWCDYIECDETPREGVVFKAIAGNAIFWENVRESGQVHPETLHAGMPVVSGQKIGMNIWSEDKGKENDAK